MSAFGNNTCFVNGKAITLPRGRSVTIRNGTIYVDGKIWTDKSHKKAKRSTPLIKITRKAAFTTSKYRLSGASEVKIINGDSFCISAEFEVESEADLAGLIMTPDAFACPNELTTCVVNIQLPPAFEEMRINGGHVELHAQVPDCAFYLEGLGCVITKSQCRALSAAGELNAVSSCFEDLKVSTMSGDVTLDDCAVVGICKLRTMSGNVNVHGGSVVGPMEVRTMSGDIFYSSPGSSAVTLKTMSGYITYTSNPDGRAILTTMSGNIRVQGVGGSVVASSTTGDLTGAGSALVEFTTEGGRDLYRRVVG